MVELSSPSNRSSPTRTFTPIPPRLDEMKPASAGLATSKTFTKSSGAGSGVGAINAVKGDLAKKALKSFSSAERILGAAQ